MLIPAVGLISLLWLSPADACEPLQPRKFLIEQAQLGNTPPNAICVKDYRVDVQRRDEDRACGEFAFLDVRPIPCDGMGLQDVGFIVRREGGTLPVGLELPEGPVSFNTANSLSIDWIDRGDEFHFVLSVTAVSKQGQRLAPHSLEVASAARPHRIPLSKVVVGTVGAFSLGFLMCYVLLRWRGTKKKTA
jgi:hypothetical protein